MLSLVYHAGYNSSTYSLCTPTVRTLLVWKIRTGKLRTYYYYYTIESTVQQQHQFLSKVQLIQYSNLKEISPIVLILDLLS